jgi:hypothetical protein
MEIDELKRGGTARPDGPNDLNTCLRTYYCIRFPRRASVSEKSLSIQMLRRRAATAPV